MYDVLTFLLEMFWRDRVCKNSYDEWKAIRKMNKKPFERIVFFQNQLNQNHNFRCNVMRAWMKIVDEMERTDLRGITMKTNEVTAHCMSYES